MTTAIQFSADNPFLTPSRDMWCALCEKKIFILTLVASMMLHAAFFLRFGDLSLHDPNKAISQSLSITLTRITPEAPPVEEQPVQKKQQPVKAQPKPEPVKQVDRPAERLIAEEPEPIEDTKQIEPVEQTVQSQENPAPIDPALLTRTKEEYMRILAAHIDKHKFYPRSARRRHIEGQVKVSFDLLENGQILNLHTFSGHPVLQKATSDSIHSALPMPPRPESLLALNTMKIEYSMQYALK